MPSIQFDAVLQINICCPGAAQLSAFHILSETNFLRKSVLEKKSLKVQETDLKFLMILRIKHHFGESSSCH